MKLSIILVLGTVFMLGCSSVSKDEQQLAYNIAHNEQFKLVKQKAKDVISTGFSAGDGYGEIWIRDFSTFMELTMDVNDHETIKEKLLIFFKFQGEDGNIVDAYTPREGMMGGAYEYIFSELEPGLAAHKNTVETDQESSLIQGIYSYVTKSGDTDFLRVEIDGKTVAERMEYALEYLMNYRYNEKYGLIWGGTTADWGDVQPEHEWGVFLTEDTHYALDIYDNAMMVIAMQNYIELVPEAATKWSPVIKVFKENIRTHLWDSEHMKFHPHIYLTDSPFPDDFNEDEIFYHGGTAVAIEAGLLSKEEIKASLETMIDNMKKTGAATIGLTMYPAYPDGFFKNPILSVPYTYQNGGDWTWFGGRMIQQLVNYGFYREAYEQVQPMLERAIINDGFYEWYTIKNEPKGSASYRGSAGVLYQALVLLEEWAAEIK